MDREQRNIEAIGDNKDSIELINFMHQFSLELIETTSEDATYKLLVKSLPQQIGVEHYGVFKINQNTNKVETIISHGNTNFDALLALQKDESIRNQLGITHKVKDNNQTSSLTKETKSSKIVSLGAEFMVPIVLKGEVSAIIVGKYSNHNTLIEPHRKLWEAVAALAGKGIIKLREKNELQEIKLQLEEVLEKKDVKLEKIIDILSSQNSELKYYNEKQKELIQELHHRVTNNLQTISSIIRLYKYGEEKDAQEALTEIYDRVQILAIIYQNIYKSMEKEYTEIDVFFHDMSSYLKSTSNGTRVDFNVQSDVQSLNFNILISLGLFVAEVFYSWLEKAKSSGIKYVDFNISIQNVQSSNSLLVTINDKEKIVLTDLIGLQSSEDISDIMISGLVDQLEGEINQGFEVGNYIHLKFKP